MHDPAPTLALRLLGGFELSAAGTSIIDARWPHRRAAAVLRSLALSPARSLHREQLMDRLWPDLDPDAAANQLYKSLHWIRSAGREHHVGELVSVADGIVRMDSAIDIDVDRFRAAATDALALPADAAHLEAVTRLYPGDLLPDDVLDERTEAQREGLRDLHLRLLLATADAREHAGDRAGAAGMLERVLVAEPWHEEAHRRLIRMHLAVGDETQAMRQYRRCRDSVMAELGVEPSAATDAEIRPILDRRMRASQGTGGAADERSLLEQLGDVERRTGDVHRSASLYERALAADDASDSQAGLRLRGKVVLAHILDGDLARAVEQVGQVERLLADEAPAYVTARTYYLLAQLRWHSGRFDEALDAAERSLAAASASGDPLQRARALEVIALACHALGDWQRGLRAEMDRQALDVSDGFDVDEAFEGHACLWEYHLYGDLPFPVVEQRVRVALERADSLGNRRAIALCLLALGSVLWTTGSWPASIDALTRSGSIADAIGAEQVAIHAYQRLGALEAAQGRLADAAARLDRTLERASRSSSAQVRHHSRTRILAATARVRLHAGDIDGARHAIDRATEVQDEVGTCTTCDALLYPTAVPVLIAAGDPGRAARATEHAEASGARFHSRSWLAASRHARGLLAAATDDRRAARRHLVAASRVFRELGQPYDQARSLEALASVLRLDGARRDAREIGDRATRIHGRLRAEPGSDRLELVFGTGKVRGRSAS